VTYGPFGPLFSGVNPFTPTDLNDMLQFMQKTVPF